MGDPFRRVRDVALALPETSERLSHGSPAFFVRGKNTFVTCHGRRHGHDHVAIWCSAATGVQDELVGQEPHRFFVPPYVGHRGWIGVRLDVDVDWDEIAAIVTEAYRNVAPASLVRRLDAGDG